MEWDPTRIRALRTALRLPQEKFAYQLGAAPKTVRNWERGRHPQALPFNGRWIGPGSLRRPSRREDFSPHSLPSEGKPEAWTASDSEEGTPRTSIMDPLFGVVRGSTPGPVPPTVTLDDLKHISAALQDDKFSLV